MKKLSLALAILCCWVVLVGCGSNWGTTAWTNSDNVNVAANTAWGTEVVVKNEGEVVADAATTKLASCLSENGVKMYGTERCGHCKNQKKLFGDAFSLVDYTDCDADKQACVDAWVRGFPTWVDADGNAYPGTQNLEKLASVAGCEG